MTNPFALHLALAFAWAAITGDFTLGNLLLGFALAFAVVAVTEPRRGPAAYARKPQRLLALAGSYAASVLAANVRVATAVLQPRLRARPALIAVPLTDASPTTTMLVANLLTMTPGTLAVDVTDDGQTLYVHALHGDDPEALRTSLRTGLERRVREVLE